MSGRSGWIGVVRIEESRGGIVGWVEEDGEGSGGSGCEDGERGGWSVLDIADGGLEERIITEVEGQQSLEILFI